MKRIRWLTAGAVLAALTISGGSIVLQTKRQHTEALRRENQRLERERQELARRAEQLEARRRELEAVVERLNVEKRVAIVDVIQQHRNESGDVVQTVLRMVEMDRNGEPLPEQMFGVSGDTPHFDALVVKFEEDLVSQGDPLRGHSLALFRRVYGESQAPEDGYWMGPPGEVPDIYRVDDDPSEFELSLWRQFWTYARDPQQAREAGVRVAQGEAVYAPMHPGERWLLTLEADGGLNLMKQPHMTADPEAGDAAGDRDARLAVPPPQPPGTAGR